ncbi:MAG TPA: DUF192 domain-containing protein [Spirochaetia bacterium]|nr:DUF192 domain-containing protein [Spirochaetia bacterium]
MKLLSKAARTALLCACVLSCAAKPSAEGPTKANPRLKTVEIAVGSALLKAEVARKPEERERGLMFRKSLAEGEGMLFVFEADQRLSFWMKNTSIPLSIAYLSSDGTIREILDLEPYSLEARSSERSVRYALEVPRGWFGKVGAAPGQRLSLPPLDE